MSAVKGRFAPSPTGRMHLGNMYAAMLSWLSAKSAGGSWLLRIEDLDPQRSRAEYARLIEDDLLWLGLEWDEGGVDGKGPSGPYVQSLRHDFYDEALGRLRDMGMVYPCVCTRADIMATQAPHQSDGRVIYGGTCRPDSMPAPWPADAPRAAARLWVPDRDITFTDRHYGSRSVNLARSCGDFVVRRADGAWSYQLAVVVDDALMGVTEVVRGSDLLLSAAQQIYLCELLGFAPPSYLHIPLLCNAAGQRLSKRDASLSMAELRRRFSPGELRGWLACMAGLMPEPESVSVAGLIDLYDESLLPAQATVAIAEIS